MNNWTRHGKRYKPIEGIPREQYGHGSSSVGAEEDANFALDEKTGLYLPAAAAKDRRKVEIGFRREA